MGKATNQQSVFTVSSIQDTNEHDLPDVDGDDGTAQDPYDVRGKDISLVKIVNGQDAELTAYLEGTTFEDEGFSEPNRYSGSGVTIAANSVGAITTEDNWSFLRVVVVFSSAPTTGNDVKAVYQLDERGD